MRKSTSIIYVFGSKLITFVVAIVKGYWFQVNLGPRMYGIINLLGLVKTILSFTTVGFDTAYLRLRSSLIGEKASEERFTQLQNNVFSFFTAFHHYLGSIVSFAIPFIVTQKEADLQKNNDVCFFSDGDTTFCADDGWILQYDMCNPEKDFHLFLSSMLFK